MDARKVPEMCPRSGNNEPRIALWSLHQVEELIMATEAADFRFGFNTQQATCQNFCLPPSDPFD